MSHSRNAPLQRFPQLAALPAAARAQLEQHLQPLAVPAGTELFRPGMACQNYLLVVEGAVRVQR